jgi:protein-glutamine gamma-glutamyltransferase
LNELLDRTLTKLQIPVRQQVQQDGETAAGFEAESVRIVAALYRYFNEGFRYTLDLTASAERLRPIKYFLERSHAGHCEFFATATVLLLRAAGIPARYATGYAVQQYSPLEQAWVIRRRHSHSWAVAWVNEQWIAVDTTPTQWFDAEARDTAWWQFVYDLGSWVWHRVSRWRLESTGQEKASSTVLWGLLPLLALLAWRVAKSRRVNRTRDARTSNAPSSRAVPHGTDSEFYRIEEMLRDYDLPRPRYCSVRAWLMQLQEQGRLPAGAQHWEELVALHYRLRFAAQGLDQRQRQQLAEGVARWLRAAQKTLDPHR